ncbi:MAG: prepilin-type N-terminal cleavage/methylation domain-containing protein [Planctomycetota bacterium]
MANRCTRCHGFTLIELLVVISVIALLIGLVLPALGAARQHARTLACLTTTRSIGQAQRMYLDDHDGYFPPTDHVGGTGAPQWDVVLAAYLGVPEVLHAWRASPLGDLDDPNLPYGEAARAYYRDLLTCPERENVSSTLDYSYGQSVWFSLTAIDFAMLGQSVERLYDREDTLPQPSATVTHGEVGGQSNHIMAHFWKYGFATPGDTVALRHQNRFNAVFADGHAATASIADTFDPSVPLDRWDPGSN